MVKELLLAKLSKVISDDILPKQRLYNSSEHYIYIYIYFFFIFLYYIYKVQSARKKNKSSNKSTQFRTKFLETFISLELGSTSTTLNSI